MGERDGMAGERRWAPALALLVVLSALALPALAGLSEDEVAGAYALRGRILAGAPAAAPALRGGAAGPDALPQLQGLEASEGANPFLHLARGVVLRAGGRGAEAQRALERASALAAGRPTVHWLLREALLAAGLRDEAKGQLDALQDAFLRVGAERAPTISALLVREAQAALDRGDLAAAEESSRWAQEFDPQSPEARLQEAAILWRRDKARFLEATGLAVRAIAARLRGYRGQEAFRANLAAGLLFGLYLALVVVGVVLFLKVEPLLAHDLGEGRLARLPAGARRSPAVALYALPILLGLGIYCTLVYLAVLAGVYLARREQVLVTLLLAVVGLAPMGFRTLGAAHLAMSSPRFRALLEVEGEGLGDEAIPVLARWTSERPNDFVPHLYLGILHRRRGDLSRAQEAQAAAARLAPEEGAPYNNLGNLLLLQGKLDDALRFYKRAQERLPRSARVRLGISRVHSERLQLDQSSAEFNEAVRLEPDLMGNLSRQGAWRTDRFLADERLPAERLHALATRLEVGPMAGALAAPFFAVVPLERVPLVAAGSVLALWMVAAWRRRRGIAQACVRCGEAFCPRCRGPAKEGDHCYQCAAVFVLKRGISGETRRERMRLAQEWQRRQALAIRVAGCLVPGAGHLVAGRTMAGAGLLLAAVWIAAGTFLIAGLAPALSFPAALPGPVRWAGGLAGLALAYGISIADCFRITAEA
jgi:Flp pilus assembly protein TadD